MTSSFPNTPRSAVGTAFSLKSKEDLVVQQEDMQIRPPSIHKIVLSIDSTDPEALRTDHSPGFPSDLM
jgi:hypothetical protein